MRQESKSFTVSLPREGNYETSTFADETSEETLMKPASVKALAARVLARNQKGNFNETCVKQQGNFHPENDPQKFHSFTGGNSDETTRPTVPIWCNARCDHFHKLVVPDLGTVLWCCQEEDSINWRRLRIDTMNSCPMEEVKR